MARGERIYGVTPVSAATWAFRCQPKKWSCCSTTWCAIWAAPPGSRSRTTSCAPLFCCAWPLLDRRFRGSPGAGRGVAALLNRHITPVVPRYGSVGASGDLMPSAYIARVLIGAGEAEFDGRRMPAAEALEAAGLKPIPFAPKEALALINGTTVMTACAALL